MDQIVKQESSIPVQARVSMVSLAELVNYWESEGYQIRTMSQLIAWSLDLLCKVLKDNEVLKVTIDSVAEAHRHMQERGLYQGSLKARAYKKVGNALRFETLRQEGIDPGGYTPTNYNVLHNPRSVEPSPVRANLTDEDIQRIAIKRLEEDKLRRQRERHEIYKQTQDAIELRKANGTLADEKEKLWTPNMVPRQLTSEEITQRGKDVEERNRKYIHDLNAPVDEQIEFMKRNVVKE